jgi:hypothetical protein
MRISNRVCSITKHKWRILFLVSGEIAATKDWIGVWDISYAPYYYRMTM